MTQAFSWRTAVVVAVAPLCWSGNFVLAKFADAHISAVQLNFWRWLLACLLLTPFVASGMATLLLAMRRHLGILLLQAFAGIALYHCLVYLALKSTSAINATLINSLVPMLIPLILFLWQGTKPRGWHVVAVLLSTCGVAVVVTGGQLAGLAELETAVGDLLMVAAATTWAVYTILLGRRPPEIAGIQFLWALSFLGTAMLVPAYALDVAFHGVFANTASNWLVVGYVAIFAAVVAFLAWNYGAARMPASQLGMFAHLIPVFGSGLAVVFLGEPFRVFHAVGATLIAAGLWIALSPSGTSRPFWKPTHTEACR